jgi:hypothetical protein
MGTDTRCQRIEFRTEVQTGDQRNGNAQRGAGGKPPIDFGRLELERACGDPR